MTKEELFSFLAGKSSCSEIPCGFWMHFPESAFAGSAAVDAHVDYYDKTHVPIVKMMNEHLYRLERPMTCPSDWRTVREMALEDTPYPDFLDEIRAFRRRMGNDALILATIHGVLVSACHATDGPGHFTDPNNTVTTHLKQDPEAVCVGLRAIARTLKRLCVACTEAGADGIYYAALGGEEHRFTQDFYEKYIAPIEIDLLDEARRHGLVFLHICKDHPRLPMFRNYPCHVVNWAEHAGSYTLAQGAALFPQKRIMGGFDNRSGAILTGTDEEIAAEIRRALEQVGRDRLVVGADCTLPGSTSTAQIRKAVEACKRL